MKTLTKLALVALLVVNGLVACTEQATENSDRGKATYVASINREPFHSPGCKWALKISPKNLQTFKTADEAIKAGHRPCKVCKP